MSSDTIPDIDDRVGVKLMGGTFNGLTVKVSKERMQQTFEYLVFSKPGWAKKIYYLRVRRIGIEVHPPSWDLVDAP